MRMCHEISVMMLVVLCSVSASLAAEFETNLLNENMQIHGFASQGYLASDQNNYYTETENGSYEFNEFGLNVGVDMTERLRVAMQLLSRDLGKFGNNAVDVDWAYGQYRWRDWFVLQAGMLQIPWGLYNETRDIDLLRPWIFLPPGLYDEQHRDVYDSMVGAGILGSTPPTRFGSVSYSLGFGEKTLDESSSTLSDEDRELFDDTHLHIDDILGGELSWDTPLDNLRISSTLGIYRAIFRGRFANHPYWIELGVPVGKMYSSTQDGKYAIFSVEYANDSLALAAEYKQQNETQGSGKNIEEGYYASAAYRATDWLECGLYYSVSYPNRDDKSGKRFQEQGRPDYLAWQKELVFTTRFNLNEWWLLKFEGHAINGVANLRIDDNPDGLQENSFLFAVKTTFSF